MVMVMVMVMMCRGRSRIHVAMRFMTVLPRTFQLKRRVTDAVFP